MRNIIYVLFMFNIASNAYSSQNIAELEESAKYINAYKKHASKDNMFNLCRANKTKESFAKCANKFMSKYNLQHEAYIKHLGVIFKKQRNFYHRLSPDGYVVLSIKNKENAPTKTELNNIVSFLNKYFKVTYETKAKEKCTDMTLPSYLQQLDKDCFNKVVSKYGLSHEKYMHYWIYWLANHTELFITDNSNNKYPVVSLKSSDNIDSGMFWALVSGHNEYSTKCLSDLQKDIKNKNNCNTYHRSLGAILPYLVKYTNNNDFKNRVYHDSRPDDARLYRENEILMRRIAKLENAETELEEKAKVLSVLKKYSETVACVTSFDGHSSLEAFLKDVYTIERDPEFGQATYYVLWHGDIGCFGGSGTHNYIISEIARDAVSRRFLVKNNDAFGKIYEQINTRFIESIRQENPNHFIIVSSKLAKDDPVNFPSLKYQYILQRQDGSWKITSRKPLAQ